MNKKDVVALKLAYNPLPLTKENCPLPLKLAGDASFPFNLKVLTEVPAVLVLEVGHRDLLLEDLWDDVMKALTTTEKHLSITGSKEQKDIMLAFVTLLAKIITVTCTLMMTHFE